MAIILKMGWYSYLDFLDEMDAIPGIVGTGAGTAISEPPGSSVSFRLSNYPNPFNPSTKIRFAFDRPTKVTLKIFDLSGREVATLIDNREYGSGEYTLEWDGSECAAGIYLYQLRTDRQVFTRKMVLLK